jgi:ribosomal protein L37AE/L43A
MWNSGGGRWRLGISCPSCNDSVIAPDCTEYVSERQIRHFWSCENCGHQLQSVVELRIKASTSLGKRLRTRAISLVA